MSASASFQIDPGTGTYGTADTAADVDTSTTVNCRLVSTSGVSSIAWRIFGTHGVAAPAITLSGNPTGQIASFDTGASLGQAYGIECKVNGGYGATGEEDTTQLSAVYVLDAHSHRPFFIGETYESDATYGVVPRLNTALVPSKFPRVVFTDVVASPHAVGASDHILLVDTITIGGAAQINLPPANANESRILFVVDSVTNASIDNITIDASGAETINGALTYVMNADDEAVQLYCTGAGWLVLSGFKE